MWDYRYFVSRGGVGCATGSKWNSGTAARWKCFSRDRVPRDIVLDLRSITSRGTEREHFANIRHQMQLGESV